MKRSFTAYWLVSLWAASTFIFFSSNIAAMPIFRFSVAEQQQIVDPSAVATPPAKMLAGAIFEGLTRLTPDNLEVASGVAKNWTLAADRRTYLFFLREDARWSSGERVTAEDFVRSWQQNLLQVDSTSTDRLYLLNHIVNEAAYFGSTRLKKGSRAPFEVEVLAKDVLKVVLFQPCDYFLQLLTLPIFFPKPQTLYDAKDRLVGNGPFILEKQGDKEMVLVKNPYYWARRQVQLEKIHVQTEANPFAVLHRYESGKLNWTGTVDLAPLSDLQLEKRKDAVVSSFDSLFFLVFSDVSEVYDDPGVRRGLSLTINRELIHRYVLYGGVSAKTSFVLPNLQDYQAQYLLAYNPKGARKEIAQAGYCTKESKGRPCTPLPPLTVVHNGESKAKKLALAVANMWRKQLGITVSVISSEALATKKRIQSSVVIKERRADVPSALAFLEGWIPYADDKYRLIFQEALKARRNGQKRRLLKQAERRLVSNLPIIPVSMSHRLSLVRQNVQGFYKNVLDMHPLKDIYFGTSVAN